MLPILIDINIFNFTITIWSYVLFNLILNPLAVIVVNIIVLTKKSVSLLKSFLSSIIMVIVVIVGARLTHVIISWGYYRDFSANPFSLSPNGFAMYGGFVVVFPVLYFLSKYTNKRFFKFLDYIAPGWTLGIVFNKIGCFLNGCCYGIPTNSILGVRFPKGSLAYNFYYNELLSESLGESIPLWSIKIHPVQLYEAGIGFICFFISLYFIRKNRKPGLAFFSSSTLYVFSRIVFHFLRAFPYKTSMNYYLILLFYIIVFIISFYLLLKIIYQKNKYNKY